MFMVIIVENFTLHRMHSQYTFACLRTEQRLWPWEQGCVVCIVLGTYTSSSPGPSEGPPELGSGDEDGIYNNDNNIVTVCFY